MVQFYETKKMFENAISVKFPISYETWLSLKDDLKAAALYVNFFDDITLAWTKAKSDFTPDEEGVSVVLQYLCKNVSKIIKEPNKYSDRYIYRVAYNSMGCLRRVKRDKDYYDNTMSNFVTTEDDQEIDIFSRIPSKKSLTNEIAHNEFDRKIWGFLRQIDDTDKTVIEFLIGQKKTLNKRATARKDVVIDELRDLLEPFQDTLW